MYMYIYIYEISHDLFPLNQPCWLGKMNTISLGEISQKIAASKVDKNALTRLRPWESGLCRVRFVSIAFKTCESYGCHMIIICLSYGYHVAILIWLRLILMMWLEYV